MGLPYLQYELGPKKDAWKFQQGRFHPFVLLVMLINANQVAESLRLPRE